MAKRNPPPRGPQLELAGELGVAFLNTAGARPDNRQQGVSSYPELVTWCQAAGTVSAPEAERLLRRAAERPAEAAAAFTLAATARTFFAEHFLAVQRQEPVAEATLAAFDRALAESTLRQRPVAAGVGAAWTWVGDPDGLDHLLAPILQSIQEVMAAAQGRPHVRQCAGEDCPLFFLDRSPTRQRRWCSMKGCGNRRKTRSYYRRVGKAERKLLRETAVPKPRGGM